MTGSRSGDERSVRWSLWRWRLLVAAGCAAVVVALFTWSLTSSTGDPRSPAARAATGSDATATQGSTVLRRSAVSGRLPVTEPSAGPSGVFATVRPTAPSASEAPPAASQHVSLVPTRVALWKAGGPSARVVPVDTQSDRRLAIPSDPHVVGWWRGGALAGDPYGGVVLVGHIDTAVDGIGYFAQLLRVRPGDAVTVDDGRLRLAYAVRSVKEVSKDALVSTTDAFSQKVPGRLVLITCTGHFDPVARHYDHNLVVIAEPTGRAAASVR